MRAFGNYILSSRFHAIAAVSLLSVFSFYISSIVVALIAMRRGGQYGLQVIIGSVVIVSVVLSIIYQIQFQDILFISLRTWIPVWCCAMMLRTSESQAVMVMTGGVFGGVFILLMYLLIDDVPGWWHSWFNNLFDTIISGDLTSEAAARIDKFKEDMALIAPMINPIIVTFLVIRLITTVLIARWWQSMLFNPGGFRTEFYGMRLPTVLFYITLVGILILMFDKEARLLPVRDLLWLMMAMYIFQGLSSVHRIVNDRKLSSTWLVLMYVLLLFPYTLPFMIVFTSCLGMADAWVKNKKNNIQNREN